MSADPGPSSPQSGNRDEWSAWEAHFRASAAGRSEARDQHQLERTRRGRRRTGLRDLAAPLLALMLLSVSVAIAAPNDEGAGDDQVTAARGEGRPIELGERNPGSGGSTRETAIVADNGNSGLVVRPSNTAKGGRAISATCDNDGLEAEDGCAVYVNKGQGAAASFRTAGSVPFAIRDTNNGLVQHLNSDRLDDLHASQIIGQARAKNGLDADTLDGQNPADIVNQARAKNGLDADTLDGQNSTDFLGKTETAADSSKVDGRDANTLIRSAFAEDDNAARLGTDGTVVSTTIEAPTSGFLFITAGSDVFNYFTQDFTRCFVEVNDTAIQATIRQVELNGGVDHNREEDCSTGGAEQVPAGTHKVDLEANGLGSNTTYDTATLQVLFIPFGADGSTP